MEKKLAVLVDNREVTTECSPVCDVAMETCSSKNDNARRNGLSAVEEVNLKITIN